MFPAISAGLGAVRTATKATMPKTVPASGLQPKFTSEDKPDIVEILNDKSREAKREKLKQDYIKRIEGFSDEAKKGLAYFKAAELANAIVRGMDLNLPDKQANQIRANVFKGARQGKFKTDQGLLVIKDKDYKAFVKEGLDNFDYSDPEKMDKVIAQSEAIKELFPKEIADAYHSLRKGQPDVYPDQLTFFVTSQLIPAMRKKMGHG